MLTHGSLFAGVGGFELGFEAAGFECLWQVEFNKYCQDVLKQHWPNAALYGDINDVNGGALPPVDVVTYGFPCQDLSIAGRRAGLEGERSGLFFEAIRVISEMRKATNGLYPRVALAENVPGLLTADGGLAMGRCLEALAEIGAVGLEWRVLDAKYFGVPQRRRRVFLAAIFDSTAAGRGQIFPEPESVSRNPRKVNQAGQEVAGTLGGGSGDRGWAPDTDRMTFVPDQRNITPYTKSRRAQNKDDYETWVDGDISPTLNVFDNAGEVRATVISVAEQTYPDNLAQTTGTITKSWHKGPGNAQAEEGCIIPSSLGVRRLTPLECERLMGWPDSHTALGASGKAIADSRRYQMCGNGVAAPVAQWVGQCISDILL